MVLVSRLKKGTGALQKDLRGLLAGTVTVRSKSY